MAKQNTLLPENYDVFFNDLKDRIRIAQVKAALAVNQALILLYWHIGREILTRQQQEGWGSKVIDRLAKDLKREFPDISGFSSRNLKYMRAFAQAYPDEQIVQQAAAQIPWFHNCALLDKVKDSQERLWYIQQTIDTVGVVIFWFCRSKAVFISVKAVASITLTERCQNRNPTLLSSS